MSEASEFFLGSAPSVIRLDTLELSHPDFSQTYRLVRQAPLGATTIVLDGDTYEYCPMRVMPIAAGDDLVQALSITLGDVGDIIATEIDAVWEANAMGTRPTITYRAFRSDDLDAPIAGSERVLDLVSVTTTRDGASFEAQAQELNASRTGILYSVESFPMLRGFF
jgi:hypothetical protein